MVASTGTGEGVTGGADVGLCFRGKGVGPGSGVGARPEFDAWRSASLGYGVPGAGDRVFGDQLRLRARAEGAAASGFELGRGFEVGSLDVQIFFADVTRSVAFSQIPFFFSAEAFAAVRRTGRTTGSLWLRSASLASLIARDLLRVTCMGGGGGRAALFLATLTFRSSWISDRNFGRNSFAFETHKLITST